MNFEDWMKHRGLSRSSTEKYVGAIQGALSSWAISNGLTIGPLTSFTSAASFKEVANAIRLLPIFKERNERGHHMYSSALAKFSDYLSEGFGSNIETDIDSILDDENLSKTERQSLVKSRIGQGLFRQKLLTYWQCCAVTGFKDTNLLIASHIKPWRASNNAERLDSFNGLLLTPNLDRAFDSGLVTFDGDGKIQTSPLLTEPEKLGITLTMTVKLAAMHEPFMAFHRSIVFRPA